MNELYLTKLRLKNFCGYRDTTFNFLKKDGKPYPYICLFGPNGDGKTSFLHAIMLLTSSHRGRSREHILQSLRKYVYSTDYDPTYNRIHSDDDASVKDTEMLIEGTYTIHGKEYIVQLTELGYIRNDLVPLSPNLDAEADESVKYARTGPWGEDYLRYCERVVHLITTDSDLELNKFQIILPRRQQLEEIVSEIMRWKASCIAYPEIIGRNHLQKQYCVDLVIEKRGTKVHYKSMSAGEKKIIKSFSTLLNLIYDLGNSSTTTSLPMVDWPRILILDNLEFHVYYDRHVSFVDCLKRVFAKHQIFATTHSGVLIPRYLRGANDQENELMIDIEKVHQCV